MQKKQLLKPTPFFVLTILCALYLLFEWITGGGAVEGWLYRMVNLLLPVLAIMIVADFVLKYLFKKLRPIILIELILSLGIIYYWIVS